jgi:ribosome maturation factor RimP
VATGQQEKEKQLQRDVTRLVENGISGVEVLALEVTGKDRFCVYIDHPQGVDHALCERVSTMLRPYVDEYAVEVSSPGAERPLRTRAHFERAVGQTVRVKTDTVRARGEVLAAGERAFQIRDGAEPTEIPYDAIVRANLIEEGRT